MISPSVQISTVRASSGTSFATAFAHGALEVPPAIWIGRHCGAPARRNTQRHPYRGGRGGCRRRSQPPRDLVRSAGWCARRAAARPGKWRFSAGRAEFMYPTGKTPLSCGGTSLARSRRSCGSPARTSRCSPVPAWRQASRDSALSSFCRGRSILRTPRAEHGLGSWEMNVASGLIHESSAEARSPGGMAIPPPKHSGR
jgi:hypothetical protein